MPYEPFHEKFPDIAERETRSITIINSHELPNDSYALVEAYCNEPHCDCRRVFLNIFSENKNTYLAVIGFGWETEQFYAQWMGENNAQVMKELKGPALNLASPQSKLAPKILKVVESAALQDEKYVERLKTHYALFRERIEKDSHSDENNNNSNVIAFSPKVGRNMPCPCGSGKKYKKCCLQ